MRRRGGTKRSSRLIFRRRLTLVRTLLRGPASRNDLITAVNREMRGEAYLGDVASAFKHDIDVIKEEYDCRIVFQRRNNRYVLEELGDLALLDLPDASLEALAFLEVAYPEGTALPEHAAIRALINQVMLLLPAERQVRQFKRRVRPSEQAADVPVGKRHSTILATVRRAIVQRRELRFIYHSPHTDGAVIEHRVAPYDIVFRSDGYAYLDATLLEIVPHNPLTPLPVALFYRLDWIQPEHLTILPAILPPARPEPPRYRLQYRLNSQVARRRDVAIHFPETEITYHADDSATVQAVTSNLWQALQVLLRYGDACTVLEPPELVQLIRTTIRGMARNYDPPDAAH